MNIILSENQFDRLFSKMTINESKTKRFIFEQPPPPSMNKKSKSYDPAFTDWTKYTSGSGGESSTTIDAVKSLGFAFSILSGFVSGGAGWAFLAGSFALAGLELKDMLNNPKVNQYDVGFFIACTLLNLDDVRFLLKGKSYSTAAVEGLFNTIKNSGKKGNEVLVSLKNSKIFQDAVAGFKANTKYINDRLLARFGMDLAKNLSNLIKSKPLKFVIGFLKLLHKAGGAAMKILESLTFFFAQAGATIGAAYFTFDQLWKFFYGSNPEKEAIRKMSGAQHLVNLISKTEPSPEVQKIIDEKTSPLYVDPKLQSEISKEFEDLMKKYGSFQDVQSTLEAKEYNYDMTHQNKSNINNIPSGLKNAAKKIYDAIDGGGTDEEMLYAGCREINNLTEFKLINIYLSDKYGENFFDLVNSPFELESDEKTKVIGILNSKPSMKGVFSISSAGNISAKYGKN